MSASTSELFDRLSRVLLDLSLFGILLQLKLVDTVLGMGAVSHPWRGRLELPSHELDLLTAGSGPMLKLCAMVFSFISGVGIRFVLKTRKN